MSAGMLLPTPQYKRCHLPGLIFFMIKVLWVLEALFLLSLSAKMFLEDIHFWLHSPNRCFSQGLPCQLVRKISTIRMLKVLDLSMQSKLLHLYILRYSRADWRMVLGAMIAFITAWLSKQLAILLFNLPSSMLVMEQMAMGNTFVWTSTQTLSGGNALLWCKLLAIWWWVS